MSEEEQIEVLESIEEPAEKERPAEIASEPLMVGLMRDVIGKVWADDPVMLDFVNHIVPPLSEQLGHVAAKGGEFAEKHVSEGRQGVERYIADQSMRAHLLNGLLPVLHAARLLQAWGAPQFRAYDETTRRVFMAGYVLHDFLKLPGTEQELEQAGFSHDNAVGAAQMSALEAIFNRWCKTLGLDEFLQAVDGAESLLHDLIYVACNTQVRWGTLRNISLLKRLQLNGSQLDLAEQLSRLADLLAYVIQTPPEAMTRKIQDEINILSDGLARLTYHHVSDNRGVLTNFIHNAALTALTHEYRQPLLYAPSGVIYLEHKKNAPPLPETAQVIEGVINKIKAVVGRHLAMSKTGFERDRSGKGIKYAAYYWLFFDLPKLIEIGREATFALITENKNPSSGNRIKKIRDGKWMPANVDLDLPNDIRVDQLADWCFLAENQVKDVLPDFQTDKFLLNEMGLLTLEDDFRAVPRDNRAGGVGYHWYFAAGHFIKKNPGLSPAEVEGKAYDWAKRLADIVASQKSEVETGKHTDWDDLHDYINQTLTLGGEAKPDLHAALQTELHRYTNAKRKGRGSTQLCALCSSPYRVDKQREAAILFAPQVYSNKKLLNSSDAIRDICSICSMEMMLRQTLMGKAVTSGKKFENRLFRYLFLYPVYFFTPETLEVIRRAHNTLKRVSFTELMRQIVNKDGDVDLSPTTLQRLQEFMLEPQESDPAGDRYVRLRFPENEPVTFYFIGVPPPSRDPKDAEAWIHPALLSLLLPLSLDVKVVASESSLPLLLEANEINETVFLDAPHAAIQYVTQKPRLNVDDILPTLQHMMTTYFIHVDANASQGASGFDYRWQDIPATARALAESPLYAFHYLKKWQRKQKQDSVPARKAAQYLQYANFLGDDPMSNHARELTQLYRQFYRAKRWNSNSILQPVSKTARAILDADTRMFSDAEALADAIYGSLRAFIERAYNEKLAFPPKGSTRESQQEAMRAFARYFVNDIFFGVFRGDKSALRGKQLNLLKNACEVIYLDEAAKDKAEREQVEQPESQVAE